MRRPGAQALGISEAGAVGASLLVLALTALALYAAVIGWLWLKQESLLFAPERLPAELVLAREPGVRELGVEVPGARLSVLQLRLPQPRGVVFYLHGNGGSLAGWFTDTEPYRRANFDLVMMDYRGYGKSTGRVHSEAQLVADVRAVWDAVAPGYAGRKLVLYGRSLGTGLAAQLGEALSAAGTPPQLTVLVSPYSSMRDLAREFYPWVPGWALRYPLDTARHLPRVAGPVLLVHGEQDTLIGAHHSLALQAVRPDARLLRLPGAGHNDIHQSAEYQRAFSAALARL